MPPVRYVLPLPFALLLAAGGCQPEPQAVMHPTWADVEPILRGQCNHCHGGSARTTGAIGGVAYRFDFYDMSPEVCGEAALAMDTSSLALALANQIKTDITVTPGVVRPRMPPAPAEVLSDWERETVLRWTAQPVKGPMPHGNQPPRLDARGFPAFIDKGLAFVASLSDPDGEPVVGVLKVRDQVYRMDRPGSFAVALDSSTWEPGPHLVTAVVCDGWQSETYEVGRVTVRR